MRWPQIERLSDRLGALYHIKQIALLAQAANRTLVLPRASGGRYGLCRAQCVAPLNTANKCSAFESYHSLAHFEGVMGIRAVAWRDFAALSQRAADDDEPLSGTMLHVRVRRLHGSSCLTSCRSRSRTDATRRAVGRGAWRTRQFASAARSRSPARRATTLAAL